MNGLQVALQQRTLSQYGKTMYRVAFGILTLTCASLAHTATLYKWTEPDGSITFATSKPPASVKYETINHAAEPAQSELDRSLAQQPPKARAAITDKQLINNSAPQVSAASTSKPLRDLPSIRASGDARISYSSPRVNGRAANTVANKQVPVKRTTAAINAANKKRGHCNELKKRVLSLESRLSKPLTPEEMDNTVVYMARYQNSYDQYCD